MKRIKFIFEKILPIVLALVLAVRMLCYDTNIVLGNYVGEFNLAYDETTFSPFPKLLTTILLFVIWIQYLAVVITIMNNYFKLPTVKIICRYIVSWNFILNLVFLVPILILFQGSSQFSILSVMLVLESLLGITLINYDIYTNKVELTFKKLLKAIGIFLLIMIPFMPIYFLQYVVGPFPMKAAIYNLRFPHRVLLYLAIIIPMVIYFILRNKPREVIRFALIIMSIGVMIGFSVGFCYDIFYNPWDLPLHLCNTALYIIPICLIFKTKRLFYFTYFINVLGAFIAMAAPNYSDGSNLFEAEIIRFWYNHWMAFFMPLLIVALKEFERPKIKQFIYSMVWFFGYYVMVLILNVVFLAFKGIDKDYFFINSEFIADKLGKWAENLFRITVSFNVSGHELVFHPPYQIVYFVVYILLGLAVWFIYNEFFRIADRHYALSMKLKTIKMNQYVSDIEITKEVRSEMMNNDIVAHLELEHFSKKYASSKVYAVKDASFEVKAGEIFGFLGPNGAGKSTIIKSMVGIQPISEGHIRVCGYDVTKNPVMAKVNIGYVPDHYALYEKLTGREYINYIADIFDVSLEDRNERINKYIKLFELESSIDSKIKTYSHGMKQKITIMSALVHNPKVWILDEPLTGLDPNSIYQVKECMKQHAAEGNIVFFSSHLIDIVEKLCSKIAIIKKGHVECVKMVSEIEENTSLEQFYLQAISGNLEDSNESN